MTLAIEGLRFSYPDFVLGPLDLDLGPEARTAVVGPSGGGKTTLLRLIAGLERPEAGRITLGGEVLDDGAKHLPPQRRRIGFVFQGLALWPHMRAVEQVRFAAGLPREAARAWLERVGLAGLEERLPGELSGGEAQRVALARALARRPRLLLLDEPLRSVDPHLRDELLVLIKDLCAELEVPLLAVTHDRDEALALGRRIAVMAGGRILEEGPAEELCAAPKHAFTARFLLGAGLLPLLREGGEFRCPLGAWPAPNGVAAAALALLPDDLEEAPDGALARVVDRRPGPGGPLAEVELGGVRLSVRGLPAAGETLRLRLRGRPRIVELGEGGLG